MKKIVKVLIVCLMFLGTLTACKDKKGEKTQKIFLEGQVNISECIDITYDELISKEEAKDDFLLYIYSPTCMGCIFFSTALKSFIDSTDTVIYRINASTLPMGHVKGLKYTPSLAFYSQGEMINLVDTDKNEKAFTSVENLTNYISKYAYLPRLKEISKETLDTLIENDSDFVLYIASSSCGDCGHFHDNVLVPYFKNEISKKVIDTIYFIDVDKFLSRSNTEEWTNFKKQYGLSEEGNAQFGYGKGFVPTVQQYENGQIVNAMVYLNDVAMQDGKIVATEGYYGSESGKVGTTYQTYKEYQDDLMPFYKNKFIEFINQCMTPKNA